MIRPKVRFLHKLFSEYQKQLSTLLDIGCGNGWFCHACAEAGIESWVVDVASKKIEVAKRVAKERDLDKLCHFDAKINIIEDVRGPLDLGGTRINTT